LTTEGQPHLAPISLRGSLASSNSLGPGAAEPGRRAYSSPAPRDDPRGPPCRTSPPSPRRLGPAHRVGSSGRRPRPGPGGSARGRPASRDGSPSARGPAPRRPPAPSSARAPRHRAASCGCRREGMAAADTGRQGSLLLLRKPWRQGIEPGDLRSKPERAHALTPSEILGDRDNGLASTADRPSPTADPPSECGCPLRGDAAACQQPLQFEPPPGQIGH
jgi:hypothetical protein